MQAEQQSERERFEAWISEDGKWSKAAQRSGDGYMLAYAQSAWTAWQAGWQARAALSHHSTPQGWKLVPVEPTMEMLDEMNAFFDASNWVLEATWKSALDAAPTPPEQGGKG